MPLPWHRTVIGCPAGPGDSSKGTSRPSMSASGTSHRYATNSCRAYDASCRCVRMRSVSVSYAKPVALY
eukprot:3470507-Prorocentrum_lima.AAC.1